MLQIKRELSERWQSNYDILSVYLQKRLDRAASEWGVPYARMEGARFFTMYLSEDVMLEKGMHEQLARMSIDSARRLGLAPEYHVSIAPVTVEMEDGSEQEAYRLAVVCRGRFEKTSREVLDDAAKATEAIIAEG